MGPIQNSLEERFKDALTILIDKNLLESNELTTACLTKERDMKINLPLYLKIDSKNFCFQFGRVVIWWQLDPMVNKEEVKANGRNEYYRKPLETGFHFFGTHLMIDLYGNHLTFA